MEPLTLSEMLLQWLIPLGFALAVIFDLTTNKIPNWFCCALLVSGVVLNVVISGWSGMGFATGGSLVALLTVPLYAKKYIAAGDVKFMLGMGALMGPTLTLWVLLIGIACGALIAPLLAVTQVGWQGLAMTFKRYYQCAITRTYFKPEPGEVAALRVPYAPALAAGWLLTLWLPLPGL
ncbi:A24 family peptidase [Ferrimonas gelatinilytica]|uniref:Prepilin type IV endopeptidase peptidase domain-containing protein n=1 Tax=Ferrimonas gelatinilytica TaxID=1255257 RepID=A0ABP9S0I2_9GAMM